MHTIRYAFCVVLLFAFSAVNAQNSAEELYQRGKFLQEEEGKLDESILWYEQALELNPNHEGAGFNVAVAYFSRHKYLKALHAFDKFLEHFPDDLEAMERKANCYYKLEDYLMAASTITEALLIQQDARLYNIRGIFYYENRDYEIASLDFDMALGMDSAYVDAWTGKGLCHLKFQEFNGAEVAFQEALRLKPDDSDVQYNLALAFCKNGKIEEAYALVSQVAQHSKLPKAYALMGLCSLKMDQIARAKTEVGKAQQLDINCMEVFQVNGLIGLQERNYEQAYKDFSEALSIHPKDEELLYNRAQASYQKSDYKEAKNDLDDALTLSPDYGDALACRANCNYMLGDLEAACSDFTRAQGLGYNPAPDEERFIFCKQ